MIQANTPTLRTTKRRPTKQPYVGFLPWAQPPRAHRGHRLLHCHQRVRTGDPRYDRDGSVPLSLCQGHHLHHGWMHPVHLLKERRHARLRNRRVLRVVRVLECLPLRHVRQDVRKTPSTQEGVRCQLSHGLGHWSAQSVGKTWPPPRLGCLSISSGVPFAIHGGMACHGRTQHDKRGASCTTVSSSGGSTWLRT